MRYQTRFLSIFGYQSILKLFEIIWQYLLAKILESRIFYLCFFQYVIVTLNYLLRNSIVADCSFILYVWIHSSFLNPRVSNSVCCRITCCIFSTQTTLNQVFAFVRYHLKSIIIKMKFTLNHIMYNFRLCSSWKWHFSR